MRKDRRITRRPARRRIRGKINGTPQRPRVSVFRSLNNLMLQAIDDTTGTTLVQSSSLSEDLRKKTKQKGGTVKAATEVGSAMAQALKDKGIENIVFDRGGFIYHGRVKAAAEAMRKAGLKF